MNSITIALDDTPFQSLIHLDPLGVTNLTYEAWIGQARLLIEGYENLKSISVDPHVLGVPIRAIYVVVEIKKNGDYCILSQAAGGRPYYRDVKDVSSRFSSVCLFNEKAARAMVDSSTELHSELTFEKVRVTELVEVFQQRYLREIELAKKAAELLKTAQDLRTPVPKID